MQCQLESFAPRTARTLDRNVTRPGRDIEHRERTRQASCKIRHAMPGGATGRRDPVQTGKSTERTAVFGVIQCRIIHEFRGQVAYHRTVSVDR